MGNILILGGTGWLGREVALSARAAGNAVTCLARGKAGDVADETALVRADRSNPNAYADVADRDWDNVIELSWNHEFAVGALHSLAERAAHWTLISTVSVYASNANPGADERDEVVEPLDLEDYGQAKVSVERASAAALSDRLLIVRPGLIAGPGDPSDRFGYWVARMALAGSEPVLSMQTGGRTAQAIDVRDLAEFTARATGAGILNAVGVSLPLEDALSRMAPIARFSGDCVDATDEWLLEHNVNYWAGPRSLPLWLPLEDAAMTTRSNAAYLAAGGALRDVDETLRDILADERARGLGRERRAGLTRSEELGLLGQLNQSGS
jgi:2'-hydroxyisoflavone reductase